MYKINQDLQYTSSLSRMEFKKYNTMSKIQSELESAQKVEELKNLLQAVCRLVTKLEERCNDRESEQISADTVTQMIIGHCSEHFVTQKEFLNDKLQRLHTQVDKKFRSLKSKINSLKQPAVAFRETERMPAGNMQTQTIHTIDSNSKSYNAVKTLELEEQASPLFTESLRSRGAISLFL